VRSGQTEIIIVSTGGIRSKQQKKQRGITTASLCEGGHYLTDLWVSSVDVVENRADEEFRRHRWGINMSANCWDDGSYVSLFFGY
jgi:hypothetical protein